MLVQLLNQFCQIGVKETISQYTLGENFFHLFVHKEVSHRWGLAYFLGSCIACRVSGGHLNPLVTVSLNLHHNPKQGWITVIIMVIAQYLGAFLGAILAFLIYWDGINWWVYKSKLKI